MSRFAREDVEDILSLTPMQWGMLVQYLKDPEGGLYHEQIRVDLEGELELNLFRRAWECVVAQNEMLRAVFRWEQLVTPVQIIRRSHRLDLRISDLRGPGSEEALAQAVRQDASQPFDLREVPFRVTLCRLSDTCWTFLKTFHHILYDGWSTRIVIGDFLAAYAALAAGKEPVRGVKARFRDHVLSLKRRDAGADENFWREYLAGLESQPLPEMPAPDAPPPVRQRQRDIVFSAEATQAARRLAQAWQLTQAQIFYAAWALVLHRYTGSGDCLFGTVVSGRDEGGIGIDQSVGMFINAPPLRLRLRGQEHLRDLLRRVGMELRLREPFVLTPIPSIKRAGGLARDSRLVDTLVGVQNFQFAEEVRDVSPALRIVGFSNRDTPTEYPFELTLMVGAELRAQVNFHEDKFAEAAVDQLMAHFASILITAQADADLTVRDVLGLGRLAEAEHWRRLLGWSVSPEPISASASTIHGLFEAQVARTPEQVGLVFQDRTLTYRELDNRANQLAHALRRAGVVPSRVVGVCLERSFELVIAILAVLKSGGTYLPIDPQTPPGRVQLLMTDANAVALIAAAERNDCPDACVIPLSKDSFEPGHAFGSELTTSPALEVSSGAIAYLIYTSGSTGKPKGVLVQHGPAAELIQVQARTFGLTALDRVLQFASPSFDLSIEEIFATLMMGATLVLREPGPPGATASFLSWCGQQGITMLNLPTAYWSELVSGLEGPDALPSTIRLVIFGGEAVSTEHVSKWFRHVGPGVALLHVYGPTEAVISATSCVLESGDPAVRRRVPIGRPLPGQRVYILDEDQQPLPQGATGELHLGGRLALGYLDRPDVTAEKFLPDPFSPVLGARMYKTGDLARFRNDGFIEFRGRRDEQIKLRGFRIELGEIEAALLQFSEVREAVVIVRDDQRGVGGDGRYLCAYLVPSEPLDTERLKAHLSTVLPAHMVPAKMVVLEQLPRTIQGKLNASQLPAPKLSGVGETPLDSAHALTPTERRLAAIWADVLGVPAASIPPDCSFFDLGGHSLSAMSLASMVEKEFGRPMPVADLFRTPVLRALGALLEQGEKKAVEPIPRAAERREYPVTSVQRRIFAAVTRTADSSTLYNMTGGVWVDGKIDLDRLSSAFAALARRHEALRTSFHLEGDVVQRVHGEVAALLERRTVTDPAQADAVVRALVRPFDLAYPPLARLAVIETGPERSLLLLDLHHIIGDGGSLGILVGDLLAFYRGESLSALPLQSKDYAVWLDSDSSRKRLRIQTEYWKRALMGAPTPAWLPTDLARPAIGNHRGATLYFSLGADRHRRLMDLARRLEATPFMTMLAVFGVFVGRMSNCEDLLLGTPVAGRRHPDLKAVVAPFVNLLPVRLRPHPQQPFSELLRQVCEQVVEVFERQEVPIDDIAKAVGVKARGGRHPFFDIVVAYEHGADAPERQLFAQGLGWRIEPYVHESGQAKFDLQLTITETENDLDAVFEYNADLFLPETATNFRDKLCLLLDGVLASPDQPINTLDWRTEFEKQLQLKADVQFDLTPDLGPSIPT